ATNVHNKLQLQSAGLRAALAGAYVELDEPTLRMEGTMHGDGYTSDGGQRRRSVQPVGVARKEGRVALDLDQVKVWRSVDDLVEQTSRGGLRMPEDAAVGVHVLRVAADVGDQEQRTPSRHWMDSNRRRGRGRPSSESRREPKPVRSRRARCAAIAAHG